MSDADDTRVLDMRINNKEFLKGTADSVKALDTLNKGIDGAGKGKGLQNMAKSADTVKSKFGIMQVAGVTAIATITNKVVNAGLNMAKSLTIGPILDGFREYEKLLTSTQTIMANTGKSTDVVGRKLKELNTYSDQTIYNFGQMADNIGKFTAAGVKVGAATTAIKGLANTAALSGSTSEQLNTAMYQVSQALSTGTIKLMDWNSLVNAGMGGKNLQNALKATARSFGDNGAAMDAAIKKGGSFRDSLQYGWLEADVFTKTMKVMSGTQDKWGKTVAYSVKELKGMGYTKEAAQDLHKLSQASIDSATEIKTFSQLVDVVKESIGSGWASVFGALFGNLEEAKAMWTDVGQTVTGFIGLMFGKLEAMLNQWRKMKDVTSGLNGFQLAWGGIANIFQILGNLIRPVAVLIASLFPASSSAGSGLFNLSLAFYNLTNWLEKATRSTSVLTPIFSALGSIIGAVVGSVWELVKIFLPLVGSMLDLVVTVGQMVGKFVEMTDLDGKIASMFAQFVEIRTAILSPFADTVSRIMDLLRMLISGDINLMEFKALFKRAFMNLGDDIGDMVSIGKNVATDIIAGLREGIGSGSINDTISGWVDSFVSFFKGLLGIHSPSTVFEGFGHDIVQGLVNGLKAAISLIGDVIGAIADELKGIDKYDMANALSLIFGGAVFLTIRKFLKSFSGAFNGFSEIMDGVSGVLGQTTKGIKTMQTGIRAKALLNIALAVGILAASLWVLSKIPADKLKVGLATVAGLLTGLTLTMKVMAASAATTKTAIASMTAMAVAMILMGGAILILSAAVLAFGMMDTGTLTKGLIAVGVLLVGLSAASFALGKAAPTMILASTGILILSVALTALAGVILLFAQLDPGSLASGLLKMGATLLVIGVAMQVFAGIGGSVLLASAAMVILSFALTGLVGTILLFSKLSFGTFAKGLGMMAIAIVALGLAGAVAAPGLIGLGIAASLIGAGLMLAGAGLALAGIGLTAIAVAGVAAGTVLASAFSAFLAVLPLIVTQLVSAFNSFVGAVAHYAPEIVDNLVKIGAEVLRGLMELGPKIAEAAVSLLTDFVGAIVDARIMIFNAAFDLITGFMQVLRDRLPELIQLGTDLIVGVLDGLSVAMPQIVTAAGDFIISFLNAVNTAVTVYMPQIIAIGLDIGKNLILGLVQGLLPDSVITAFTNFVTTIVNFFKGLLGINSPSTVFAGFGRNIVEGLANGLRAAIGLATSAVSNLVSAVIGFVKGLPGKARSALSGLGGILKSVFSSAFNAAKSAVSSGVSSIGSAISKIPGVLRSAIGAVKGAATSLGSSIMEGIKSGLGKAINAVGNFASVIKDGIKSGINNALNLPFNIPRISIKVGPKSFGVGGQQLIPRFAKGVTGFGGGTALVGEVGPELVTMGKGANVITNKNIMGFMKQVASLTRVLSSGGATKNSPGGNISYVVSADFRGNPKASGTQFAVNITQGLINGLTNSQPAVNNAMVGVGTSMSTAFEDILGIASPSKVFHKYAGYVGQGFINGLVDSTTRVAAAATAMGQASITAVAKTITDGALKLEALRGKADAYAAVAAEARQKANQKKLSKGQKKRYDRLADKAESRASRETKAADRQQSRAEAEAANIERNQKYNESDAAGRSDMRKEDAANAAAAASAARQQSIKLSKQADLVRKKDKKRAKELDKQAAAALARSKQLADAANSYAVDSYNLSLQAKADADAEANAQKIADAAATAAQMTSVSAADVIKAQNAVAQFTKQMSDTEAAASRDPAPTISLTQHNTSPEALSASEIYRNTKNLLSSTEKKLADATP